MVMKGRTILQMSYHPRNADAIHPIYCILLGFWSAALYGPFVSNSHTSLTSSLTRGCIAMLIIISSCLLYPINKYAFISISALLDDQHFLYTVAYQCRMKKRCPSAVRPNINYQTDKLLPLLFSWLSILSLYKHLSHSYRREILRVCSFIFCLDRKEPRWRPIGHPAVSSLL